MIIVDTSVLIDYLKGNQNYSVLKFDYIIESRLPYGINCFIYQEVLQGAKNEKEYKLLKEYLSSLPLYYLQNGLESYSAAAFNNMRCKKSGVTIRSTIDLLIAQTAIENNLFLLHNDNDYTNMSKIISDLKIYE